MSLDDIARQTLININFLQAIEAGDTEHSCRRRTCGHSCGHMHPSVGLDPAYVMRRFDGKKEPAEPPPPRTIARPGRTTGGGQHRHPPFWSRSGVRTWGVTLVVLLGVAIIVYFTQPSSTGHGADG